MSPKPIARSPSIERLIADGYEIEIRHQHLLVHSVPYVTSARQVAYGTLVCPYTDVDGQDGKPNTHEMWFTGEPPCNAQGQVLTHLVHQTETRNIFAQFTIRSGFSNKPVDQPNFPENFFDKVVHYATLLTAQAAVIEPNADARTGRVIESREENPVFLYPDSASARAGIMATAQKLTHHRIGLVGLGGTGSYILDQVAKTHVREIHLFDGDDFKRHNAFRAPGAASLEQLRQLPKKVHYFQHLYGAMRTGIVPHAYHLTAENVDELRGLDFVFVAVDDGAARKLICNHLTAAGVPFIDVGMGMERVPETDSLLGLCRVTVGTAGKSDHLPVRLPVHDDPNEALYRSNIQVADINAMNAILAVIRWKQHCGYYADYDQAHHLTYSIAMQSVARAELVTEADVALVND